MTIPDSYWQAYIDALRKVNNTAADKMLSFMNTHRDANGLWDAPEIRQQLIDYAYSLSTKYGEAAAELACEMYDTMGIISNVVIPAAVPAATATFGEIAKVVNGVLKQSANEEMMASAVGRQVKMVGVDTVMHNALRDGAEWAWIPRGDTCAFCVGLAANGWQRASKKALRNGHAEHIHANCDCTYAVRFNSNTEVEGYTPDDYMKDFQSALNSQGIEDDVDDLRHKQMNKEAINALRREDYAKNKARINAQKRDAYAKREERDASSAEEINLNT